MINKLIIETLPKLISLCVEAGNYQVLNHLQDNKFSSKENNTPLSEIDIKSNEIISTGIRKIDKKYPIVSEEHYEDINPGDSFWIIDPLDGTRNYLNHGNEFCINIAFIKNEYPSFGLIYSPISKISYYAVEGRGSYILRNSQSSSSALKITCNTLNSNEPESDIKATILTSSSMNAKKLELITKRFVSPKIKKMSSALKFGLIASGEGDFYPRLGPTHEWDTAAGQCIIEEAGGSVVDKNMSRLKYCKNKTYLNNEFFAIGDKSYDWSDLIKSLSC